MGRFLSAVIFACICAASHARPSLAELLPPRIVCASRAEALKLAGKDATPVLGTGSMRPLIPASAPGLDPRATVVAYAVMVRNATFADVARGNICVYLPDWDNGGSPVMHQAVQLDRYGWIMSGSANPRSESHWRVTAANFRAVVARVYVWTVSP